MTPAPSNAELADLPENLEQHAAYWELWAQDIRANNGTSVDADYADRVARDLRLAAARLREAEGAGAAVLSALQGTADVLRSCASGHGFGAGMDDEAREFLRGVADKLYPVKIGADHD